MAAYKKFLIQQQSFDGSIYQNVGDVIDTCQQFNVVCQQMPFKRLPETKELAKNDWSDEDGEDVYIPSAGLKFKAYDLEATFLYVGTKQDFATDLMNFTNFIYGRNENGNPFLKIYDEYTQIGRRGVFVMSVNEEKLIYDDVNPDAIAQIKVKFRVTDPVTDITYRNGELV